MGLRNAVVEEVPPIEGNLPEGATLMLIGNVFGYEPDVDIKNTGLSTKDYGQVANVAIAAVVTEFSQVYNMKQYLEYVAPENVPEQNTVRGHFGDMGITGDALFVISDKLQMGWVLQPEKSRPASRKVVCVPFAPRLTNYMVFKLVALYSQPEGELAGYKLETQDDTFRITNSITGGHTLAHYAVLAYLHLSGKKRLEVSVFEAQRGTVKSWLKYAFLKQLLSWTGHGSHTTTEVKKIEARMSPEGIAKSERHEMLQLELEREAGFIDSEEYEEIEDE